MSVSMDVFVDTKIPLEELAKEVGELLGLKFEYQRDEYEEWYAVRNEEGLFTIGTHDFEGEEDWNLNKYKYDITFWENRDKEPKERERLRNEVGRRIFEKLKATSKYPLLYVYDAQQKLDEYRPFETNAKVK